nr:cofactor modifying protein [Pyrococcus furiosus DSM 3638]
MKYLYLEITSRCNLRCEMCFKQHWEDEEGDMDYDLFLKILRRCREVSRAKDDILRRSIGEPTVHPRFMDMVREVKKRGFALGISTNGTLLTDEMLKELAELGVDLVYFSMDVLPTAQNVVTLGHILAGVTAEKIKKLVKYREEVGTHKPSIGVEVVVTKENYKQLPELARYLLNLGVDAMLVSNLLPLTPEQVNDIVYDGSIDMTPIVNELYKIAHNGLYIKLPYFELKTERVCDFDENKVAVIRWDGEVVPCYRFLHTYREYIFGREKKVNTYSFGNVREKSLADIWTSERYTWFRFITKNYLYPSCTDCSLRDACDFVKTTDIDCWGNEPSCADCLWSRRIVMCPIPQYNFGKFL